MLLQSHVSRPLSPPEITFLEPITGKEIKAYIDEEYQNNYTLFCEGNHLGSMCEELPGRFYLWGPPTELFHLAAEQFEKLKGMDEN